MDFEEMDKELMERAKVCTSIEELRTFCSDQGVELTEEALSGIAGGSGFPDFGCTTNSLCLSVSSPSCPNVLT